MVVKVKYIEKIIRILNKSEFNCVLTKIKNEIKIDKINKKINFTFINLKLSLIHFKLGPMDIKNKNGINSGISNSLKKGGPIEIFSFSITSKNIG